MWNLGNILLTGNVTNILYNKDISKQLSDTSLGSGNNPVRYI